MEPARILRSARTRAGLSLRQLAARARTAHPNIAAYEQGRASPTSRTLERLVRACGEELVSRPLPVFHEVPAWGGRPIHVPDRLPRLEPADALRTVTLPAHVAWSANQGPYDLSDPVQRDIAYGLVMDQGRPEDIAQVVDATLLLEIWDQAVLTRPVKTAWAPLVERERQATS